MSPRHCRNISACPLCWWACLPARIRILEEYIAASPGDKIEMTNALTQEFWVLELYRTSIATLEGILWLLLLFSLIVFGAYWLVRKVKLNKQQGSQNLPELKNAKSAAD